MLQLFAEKAEKCNRQIEVLTSGNLRQRVAAYLLENCDPDYRVRLHEQGRSGSISEYYKTISVAYAAYFTG